MDGGTGDRCRCPGWPTILIHDAHDQLIDRWTLHHQESIRSLGDCDADLRDGPALTAWLAERGLTGSQRVAAGRPRRTASDALDTSRSTWVDRGREGHGTSPK
ncbi:hypothetical protein ACGFNU_33140 [Spirillospora sp. NPDC048911]|uniref:hypothetical protein n=1 Tax=Spirillospora sp. NPDC048911 TaxID=3364527 RepID=UPI003716D985